MGGGAVLRLAAAAMLAPALAQAGAWTLDPGAGFVSAGASYYSNDAGTFEQVSAAAFLEYGLREGLTLGGSLEGDFPVGVASGQSARGSVTAHARGRLHVGPHGDPFSVQVGAILPLGDIVDTGQAQIDGERALDGRALYGRGFATDWGDAFVDLQGGLRLRLDDGADEIRIDLTAGVRPAPRWLVMLQSFNTIGLRNPDPGGQDFDVYKLAPAVGYELFDGVTVLLGGEREIAGRNIDRGWRVRAAVWTTF
jgi:hypothetical protein